MHVNSNWTDTQKTSQEKKEAPCMGVEAQFPLESINIY